MKFKMLALLLMLVSLTSLSVPARAQEGGDGSAARLVFTSLGCTASIVNSKNPGQAAQIGVPILAIGNVIAFKLHRSHPKLAGVLQFASGAGCVAGALTRSEPFKPAVAFSGTTPQSLVGRTSPTIIKPITDPSADPTSSTGSETTTSGTDSGSGAGGGSGTGSGDGSGSGSGGTGSGSSPCTVHGGTDCGFGNGGFNGGNNPLPPMPVPGQPHSN